MLEDQTFQTFNAMGSDLTSRTSVLILRIRVSFQYLSFFSKRIYSSHLFIF